MVEIYSHFTAIYGWNTFSMSPLFIVEPHSYFITIYSGSTLLFHKYIWWKCTLTLPLMIVEAHSGKTEGGF